MALSGPGTTAGWVCVRCSDQPTYAVGTPWAASLQGEIWGLVTSEHPSSSLLSEPCYLLKAHVCSAGERCFSALPASVAVTR